MKHLTTLLATIAVVLSVFVSSASHAQASASAQVGATIVTPMTIAKVSDMEFQNVNHTAAARRSSKKAAKIAAPSAVKPAAFTVSGYANYAFAVAVPQTVTMSNGTHDITIENIIAEGATNQVLSATGTGTFSITGKPSIRPSEMMAIAEPVDGEDAEELINGIPVTILYN